MRNSTAAGIILAIFFPLLIYAALAAPRHDRHHAEDKRLDAKVDAMIELDDAIKGGAVCRPILWPGIALGDIVRCVMPETNSVIVCEPNGCLSEHEFQLRWAIERDEFDRKINSQSEK